MTFSRSKEPFEVIDPQQQQAVLMVAELQQLSAKNQALLLARIRRRNPTLALLVVKLLKTTASPGTDANP